MIPDLLPLDWDPALVEDTVLRATRDSPDELELRRERDLLYPEPEGAVREAAFRELHGRWFTRLGLDTPIRTALEELPLLASSCARGVVWRAAQRGDAGADLHVRATASLRPADRASRTVVIRLPATAFARQAELEAFLREELLHVSDMLDPAFGYEPDLADPTGEPIYLQLLRDRYRVLWKTTVQGRLVHWGALPADTHDVARHAFAATFPMLDPATIDDTFAQFFHMTMPEHALLAGFAARPGGSAPTSGLSPGGLCSLCRLPTHAPERATLEPDLIGAIRTDFPTWQPAHGLCRQCADLYRASALSRREAATLPG